METALAAFRVFVRKALAWIRAPSIGNPWVSVTETKRIVIAAADAGGASRVFTTSGMAGFLMAAKARIPRQAHPGTIQKSARTRIDVYPLLVPGLLPAVLLLLLFFMGLSLTHCFFAVLEGPAEWVANFWKPLGAEEQEGNHENDQEILRTKSPHDRYPCSFLRLNSPSQRPA
jgi:hypothetical protein